MSITPVIPSHEDIVHV